jgi:UDP-hydrolysing UDP-N-acetyl-D-glucosamine 2-epimerase
MSIKRTPMMQKKNLRSLRSRGKAFPVPAPGHRTIAVVTVGRSDWGLYLPLLRRIRRDRGLRLHLIASGAHLSDRFGRTEEMIRGDGFTIGTRVDMLEASDNPKGIARSMGRGVAGFADAYARIRPDLLVVLGDRFEMFSAALAALPFRIPVAHIHGGELTQGAMDDALRHAMTKLSHLHFVSTAAYGRRVEQLGEAPWRITVSGALALDHLNTLPLYSRRGLERLLGIPFSPAPLLITYHPVTLEAEETPAQAEELLAALADSDRPLLFTMPNADTANSVIRKKILAFAARRPNAYLFENLGTRAYFSAMRHAAAMVGNSSSGILEAPSFGLPVVNIGLRQEGRIRAANVLDVPCRRAAILGALRRALDEGFRNTLAGLRNPYGSGRAAEMIVRKLNSVRLNRRLLIKAFRDLPAAGGPEAGA